LAIHNLEILESAVIGRSGESKGVGVDSAGITGEVDTDVAKDNVVGVTDATAIEDTSPFQIDRNTIFNKIGHIVATDVDTGPESGEGTQTTIIGPILAIVKGKDLASRKDRSKDDGALAASLSKELASYSDNQGGRITRIGEVGTIRVNDGTLFDGKDGVVDDVDAIHQDPVLVTCPDGIVGDIIVDEDSRFFRIECIALWDLVCIGRATGPGHIGFYVYSQPRMTIEMFYINLRFYLRNHFGTQCDP
jgi:hypothetical protein